MEPNQCNRRVFAGIRERGFRIRRHHPDAGELCYHPAAIGRFFDLRCHLGLLVIGLLAAAPAAAQTINFYPPIGQAASNSSYTLNGGATSSSTFSLTGSSANEIAPLAQSTSAPLLVSGGVVSGTTGAGSTLTLTGGNGGSTSGSGGSVTLEAGSTNTGSGGSVTITATSGAGSGNRAGGALNMTAGNSLGTQAAGAISVTAGTANGSGSAGSITITAGAGDSSAGGNVTVDAGDSTSGDGGNFVFDAGAAMGSGIGGSLELNSGASSGSNGGAVILDAAEGTSAADNGMIQLETDNNTQLQIGPTGLVSIPNIATGTDTYAVCADSSFNLVIDSSNCITSSARFKRDIAPLADASALMRLRAVSFRKIVPAGPIRDPNLAALQVGLIAENVAAVLPDCAVYENDMKTPKSYRPECITAYLVKFAQDHQRELIRDKIEIYGLAAWCILLTLWCAHLHIQARVTKLRATKEDP